jgi:DNA-binding XRE family transcriptional regulator
MNEIKDDEELTDEQFLVYMKTVSEELEAKQRAYKLNNPPTQSTLLPKALRILTDFGINIKLARLRRKISAKLLSERVGISKTTLSRVEKGSPNVAMGTYVQVLFVLGMENDLSKVATDDLLSSKLKELNISIKKRAPKKKLQK